jgi:hypothetical protein
MGPRRREVRLGALPGKRFLKVHRGGGARKIRARTPPVKCTVARRRRPAPWGRRWAFFWGGGAGGAHVAASTSCLASAPKSGKAPLFSLEYTSLPSKVTSKAPGGARHLRVRHQLLNRVPVVG